MTQNYQLPRYILYFDTNVAYSKKPSEAISSKIGTVLKKVRKRTQVEVRVPEVVFEELIYQQYQIAKAAKDNLIKNSRTLKEVCGSSDVPTPNDEQLKKGIRERFNLVAESNSIVILQTPVDAIDWNEVVRSSCWRLPPFERPKSDDDLAEKGFRDKVILETIKHDALMASDVTLAFVSADNLLRATFEEQVKSSCPVEVYKGIDEFLGGLELLWETKSKTFAKEVLSKASSVFYNPENPECVALSQGVIDHLTNEHSEEMAKPSILHIGFSKNPQNTRQFSTHYQPLAGTNLLTGNWLEEIKNWSPVSALSAFASPPVFQHIVDHGRYQWKSTITLVRLLRRNGAQWNESYGLPEERIRTKDVDVIWSCEVDHANAHFSNFKIEAYEPTFRDSFVEADWKTRSAFNLPLFPGSDETSS